MTGQATTTPRWPKMAKFLIGLLTAVGTFLAGLSGVLGATNAGLQQAKADASAKVSTAQTVIVNLRTDNQTLESRYQSLSKQAAAAPGDDAAPSGDALPVGVEPRHDDDALTIQSSERVDIDSPASNPRWDDGDGTKDLYFQDGELRPGYGAMMLVLPKGTAATYTACNTSGFSDNVSLSLRENAAGGDYFCVQTSANRIAAAKIITIEDSSIVLSVKVWDPPISR